MGQYPPRLQQLVAAITATGFTAVLLALGVVLLTGVDQIKDILIQVDQSAHLLHRFGFILGGLSFSLACWWSARLVFDAMAESYSTHAALASSSDSCAIPAPSAGISPNLALWLPRVYAAVMPVVVIIAGACAGLWVLVFLCALGVLAPALLFVIYRRKLIAHVFGDQQPKLLQLLGDTKSWGVLAGILYFLVTVWALVDPYSLGEHLGAFFVVFWGLSSILFCLIVAFCGALPWLVKKAFGPLVEKQQTEYDIQQQAQPTETLSLPWLLWLSKSHWVKPPHPVLIPVLLLAGLMAWLVDTDNHQVRRETVASPYAYEQFDDAWQAFAEQLVTSDLYLTSVAGEAEQTARKKPVFFVASQGGGLRAAYWAAVGMGYLEARIPGFSQHVFSLAGVSGGSVGNSFYAAGLNQPVKHYNCKGRDEREQLACGLEHAVGSDYLSPVLTSFLYNDLLYRFFPVSGWNFLARDRAAVLETSWEKGFAEAFSSNNMQSTLQSLYQTPSDKWRPLLMSMGAHQESGARLITAPFAIDSSIFINQYNTYELMGCDQKFAVSCDMNLSTVALNAARFPFVTPAGTLRKTDDKGERIDWADKDHIIDGGYVENYGLMASRSMINHLINNEQLTLVESGEKIELVPVVIIFANDMDLTTEVFNPGRSRPYRGGTSMAFNEITNPLQGLLTTRSGRSVQSLTELIDFQHRLGENQIATQITFPEPDGDEKPVLMNNVVVFHLQKDASNVSVPLGWWLSDQSQAYMSGQYTTQGTRANQAIESLAGVIEKK